MVDINEKLKSINVVKQLNDDKYQLYELNYSGGRNTLTKAIREVAKERGLIDNESNIRDIHNMYEREILNKYEELIDLGKSRMDFHSKVGRLLGDMFADIKSI